MNKDLGLKLKLIIISSPAINISTSVQLGFVLSSKELQNSEVLAKPCLSFFPYFNEQYLCLLAGLNGGNALGYLAKCVGNWIIQLGMFFLWNINLFIFKLISLMVARYICAIILYNCNYYI